MKRSSTVYANVNETIFLLVWKSGSLAACNKTEISVERVFVDCQTTTNKGYCSKCISLLNDAPKGTGSQNTTLGFFRIGDMIELLSGDKVRVREPSHHSVVLTHKRFYTWEVGAVFFGSRCKSSFKSKAHRMETHNTVDELIGNIRDAIEDLHACEKIEHVTPTPKVFCCDACDNTTDPTLERLTFKRLLYPNRVSCEGKCGLALESSYVVRYWRRYSGNCTHNENDTNLSNLLWLAGTKILF